MQPSIGVNPQFYANNLVSDVPSMLCSGVGMVPRATSHKILISTSTTASQTSCGVSIVNLQGTGYLKTGSAYLKIKFIIWQYDTFTIINYKPFNSIK